MGTTIWLLHQLLIFLTDYWMMIFGFIIVIGSIALARFYMLLIEGMMKLLEWAMDLMDSFFDLF